MKTKPRSLQETQGDSSHVDSCSFELEFVERRKAIRPDLSRFFAGLLHQVLQSTFATDQFRGGAWMKKSQPRRVASGSPNDGPNQA